MIILGIVALTVFSFEYGAVYLLVGNHLVAALITGVPLAAVAAYSIRRYAYSPPVGRHARVRPTRRTARYQEHTDRLTPR
jgi:hypothetical protein